MDGAAPVQGSPEAANAKLAHAAFVRGGQLYGAGRYREALSAFKTASANAPENPVYHYLLAISQHQLNQLEETARTANLAGELERPIKNWAEVLARYQDRPRRWLKQHRSKVLAEIGRPFHAISSSVREAVGYVPSQFSFGSSASKE